MRFHRAAALRCRGWPQHCDAQTARGSSALSPFSRPPTNTYTSHQHVHFEKLHLSNPCPPLQPITALHSFRDNRATLLLATPAAARGLDLPAVSHVYNTAAPATAADYLHRAGRAGRIGSPVPGAPFVAGLFIWWVLCLPRQSQSATCAGRGGGAHRIPGARCVLFIWWVLLVGGGWGGRITSGPGWGQWCALLGGARGMGMSTFLCASGWQRAGGQSAVVAAACTTTLVPCQAQCHSKEGCAGAATHLLGATPDPNLTQFPGTSLHLRPPSHTHTPTHFTLPRPYISHTYTPGRRCHHPGEPGRGGGEAAGARGRAGPQPAAGMAVQRVFAGGLLPYRDLICWKEAMFYRTLKGLALGQLPPAGLGLGLRQVCGPHPTSHPGQPRE